MHGIGEQTMNRYRITYYKDGVQHTAVVAAKNRREALQKAWSLFDTDDLYISEVEVAQAGGNG